MPISGGQAGKGLSQMIITARFDLAPGANLVFPSGRLLIGIFSTDSDFDDLDLETYEALPFWRQWVKDDILPWVPDDQSWNPFPAWIITDGVNTRIVNAGANPISNMQYMYMEI